MTRVILYSTLEKPNKVCNCNICMDGLPKFFVAYMSECSVYSEKLRASIIQPYQPAFATYGHRLFNAFCHSMLEKENELYNFFDPTLAREVAKECFCSYMLWRLSLMRDFGYASDIP